MKVYQATRPGVPVTVLSPSWGGRIYPLVHHPHHSPDGHSWGYGGSGPSELARDILWDLLGSQPDADLYQAFKWAYIAALDQHAGFAISEGAIRAWLASYDGRLAEQEVVP